jgi:hypothetical protein
VAADVPLPEGSTFFATLTTALTKPQIAAHFHAVGWAVRHCAREDLELRCAWAELVLDGDTDLLLHGPVAEVEQRAPEIIALLVSAQIAVQAEWYDAEGRVVMTAAVDGNGCGH